MMTDHERDPAGDPGLSDEEDLPDSVPVVGQPAKPSWWEGEWPAGGIDSLAALERYVDARLNRMIRLNWSCPDSLGDVGRDLARQALVNATRYLARHGARAHPRPRPEQLELVGDIETALESVLRHIRQERATAEAGPDPTPGQRPAEARVDQAPGDEAGAADSPADGVDPNVFVIDQATFSVRWNGRECRLGNSKPYKLLVELAGRRPGQYASIEALIDDVWAGDDPLKGTVHRTVSSLRQKLRAAGIGDVIESVPDHYRLRLPDGTRARVVEVVRKKP